MIVPDIFDIRYFRKKSLKLDLFEFKSYFFILKVLIFERNVSLYHWIL